MNLAKHIRKPMPAPTSVHRGVKDSTRSKAVDLSEWEFEDFTPKADPDHLALVEAGVWEFDDLPALGVTEGRGWSLPIDSNEIRSV